MKSAFPPFLAWLLIGLSPQSANASVIAYAATNGGSYNLVGVYESPQFIGDKFTVTVSGWLDTISFPSGSVSFDNTPVVGKITISTDDNGAVGNPIFSASISTTNPPTGSNNELPPFTVVSATAQNSVFLSAGVNYWLTFSETDGRDDLTIYSAVYSSSLETVFFDQGGTIQYTTGLQPTVAIIRLNLNSPESAGPTNLVSLSATALLQAPIKSDSSIPAPVRYVINTQRILSWLAIDEFQAGVYGTSNFPAGAGLAIIGSQFAVVDKNKKPILDVSNILTGRFGTNDITSGKETLHGRIQTSQQIFSLDYNDSSIGGSVGVNFHLSGLMTSIATPLPTKETGPTEVTTDNWSSAAGEGSLRGVPFVITGSFSASGSSTSVAQ